MRDIYQVIHEKQAELERVNEELKALRLTVRLLTGEPEATASEEDASSRKGGKLPPTRQEAGSTQPARITTFP